MKKGIILGLAVMAFGGTALAQPTQDLSCSFQSGSIAKKGIIGRCRVEVSACTLTTTDPCQSTLVAFCNEEPLFGGNAIISFVNGAALIKGDGRDAPTLFVDIGSIPTTQTIASAFLDVDPDRIIGHGGIGKGGTGAIGGRLEGFCRIGPVVTPSPTPSPTSTPSGRPGTHRDEMQSE